MKFESENLRGNKSFEYAERKNISKVEKVGHRNSVILNHKYSDSIHLDPNHTDLILNLNHKYSDSIHVDTNQTDLNKPIPANLKNIGSIHDSDDICAIEKILTSPVHSPVPTSPIFWYWRASDPPSPFHESSAEIVTPKVNHKPCNNPPNPVPNVPYDLDSDPTLSDSSSLD